MNSDLKALISNIAIESDPDILAGDTVFVEVILPVPIPKLFTYRVPAVWNEKVKIGQRTIVPFGQRKILTGIIARLHHQPPLEYEAKYLLELLDEHSIITQLQFKLYQWMADYYLCTLGEVMNAALPAGLKLSSESMVQLHPAFLLEESLFDFSEKERLLINRLAADTLSYSEVAKFLEVKSVFSILKSLASKDAVIIFEKVKEKYKPKTEKRLRLLPEYIFKEKLEALFEALAAKPKQESVLLRYLQNVPVFNEPTINANGISKSSLLSDDISESSIQTLIKNKVLEEFEIVVPRFGFPKSTEHPLLLSESQEVARNAILESFEKLDTALLHGITGSGKTEIYIDLIRKALEGGSQVLYLLPEIALTTQIVQRLIKIFGAEMGVYHSKFSDNERVEVWNGVLNGKFRFVVGVRSSIFLPFDNLGLIIVDEEHDPSYKQQNPAPRYHARDVALMMGQHHHAKVLMGTATPSCESFYLAQEEKIGLITLKERFGAAQLPKVVFADLSKERKQKTIKGEFSSLLLNDIKETISQKEQVILFQNRRGHSPLVQCEDCSWVPKCINCAVSLTYHQYRHSLICHYCGYREELPKQCPTCSSKRILTLGYGTEKMEEELKLYFPDAAVGRMDLDTTRTRSGYETILGDFEKGETQILVGTQMVTKGLDFDHVGLVGVFDADRMMHFPDFRSFERAFQLIIQVSGRAGRREKQGKVIIQTSNPHHPLFNYVIQHDIKGFLVDQLDDRQLNGYPPYTRLIEITLKHIDKNICRKSAEWFAGEMRQKLKGIKIMGPGEPMISKIRNEFLNTILLKVPRNQGQLQATKQSLLAFAERAGDEKEFRNVRIVFDVDPV